MSQTRINDIHARKQEKVDTHPLHEEKKTKKAAAFFTYTQCLPANAGLAKAPTHPQPNNKKKPTRRMALTKHNGQNGHLTNIIYLKNKRGNSAKASA